MPYYVPKAPIAEMLVKYKKEKNIRFHMPGHKGKFSYEGFKCLSYVAPFDVTEVPGTDNLHEPAGAIQEAEKLLAKAYNAEKSFLLVNGSTTGILVAVGTAFNKGDKIIIDENSHKSIHNAIELFELEMIKVKIVSPGNIREIMAKEKLCKGVVLTRPDYYGICSDIKEISRLCRAEELILITDEAHGSHLNFAGDGYPVSAVKYSDYTIQSAHKTLGALNQSAYLHLNNKGTKYYNEVRKLLGIFQTSSPSYIILASGDCARAYMETYGSELLGKLKENVEWAAKQIKARTKFTVLDGKGLPFGITKTPDRLVINTSSGGFIGSSVEKYLRSKSIQVEMSDKNNIVCLCSIYDSKEDFEKLIDVLCELEKYADMMEEDTSGDVRNRQDILEELRNQIGKKVLFDIVQYPPGIPLIKEGELLTANIYNEIEGLYMSGVNILGMYGFNDNEENGEDEEGDE